MCEAGEDVPDPVAERIRVGFPQALVIAEAEEARPRREIGGDVRGYDPTAVDLPDFDGSPRSPIALAVRTPPVSTTACSQ
jgi:hypothetical protein